MSSRFERAVNVVFGLACVTVVVVGSIQVYERVARSAASRNAPEPVEAVTGVTIDLTRATVLKNGDPKVVLVEFSDFQCPFCGKHARETFQEIRRQFVDTGKLAYAFLNAPIEQIHPLAVEAGAAAECAGLNGKFWEMHDVLFRSQSALAQPDLARMAADLGVSGAQFDGCLPKGVLRIREQAALAESIGVNSTPTFFIARAAPTIVHPTVRISGALPLRLFAVEIEAAIRKQ